VYEIKHDGWRLVARKSGPKVRLWTRQAHDQTHAFRAIAHAIGMLPVTSLVLDGEAVAHQLDGLPDFHALQSADGAASAVLFAFDLLELEGEDLRKRPLSHRRDLLEEVIYDPLDGLRVSELFDGEGPDLFRHVCAFNLEGVIAKRRSSRYRSGPSDDWRKIKCPEYVRR
jgi:bifunctional non-homologous end joining protein LigD